MRPAASRELRVDQVDTGDLLGDGVLDLEPRVRLDEGESDSPPCGSGDEELERPEAVESRGLRRVSRPRRGVARGAPRRGRGRRDLDELLVPTLQAALALAEVDDGARSVADDLHLDVARARQQRST